MEIIEVTREQLKGILLDLGAFKGCTEFLDKILKAYSITIKGVKYVVIDNISNNNSLEEAI